MKIFSCVASQIKDVVRRALISLSFLNIYNVASRESETHSLTKQQKKEITTFSKAYRALTRPAEEQKTKQLSQKLIGRSPVPPKNKKLKLSFMFLFPLIFFNSVYAYTAPSLGSTVVSNGTTYYVISTASFDVNYPNGDSWSQNIPITGVSGNSYMNNNTNTSFYLGYTYSAVQLTRVATDPYNQMNYFVFYRLSNAPVCSVGQAPDSVTGVCQVPTCVIPLVLNPQTLTCDIPTCQAGQVWSTSSNSCVSACTAPQIWSTTYNKCVQPCNAPNWSDNSGVCHGACPSGASASVSDGKCYFNCSHFHSDCNSHLDYDGAKCDYHITLFPPSVSCERFNLNTGALGSRSNPIFFPLGGLALTAETAISLIARSVNGALPDTLPAFEPQPLPKELPANDPNYVPIPKPANDPNYTPPVVIPDIPVIDPAVIPDPLPDVTPNPAPLPDPTIDPAPLPDPTIDPAPSPAPSISPAPAPSPLLDPAPLPAPLPDVVSEPAPTPAPSPLPEPAPSPDPTINPAPDSSFNPDPTSTPAVDPATMPDYLFPDVPNILNFSTDDMEHFETDVATLGQNLNTQIGNIQTTFGDTYAMLSQGFPAPSLDTSGSCGSSMAFNFAGKSIDLCPTLTTTSARFAPLFSMLTFLMGLFVAIKIYLSGLKD